MLFDNGNQHTDLTGGWLAKASNKGAAGTPVMPSLTIGNTMDIAVANNTYGNGIVYTANRIVCDGLQTLNFKIEGATVGSPSQLEFGLTNTIDPGFSFIKAKSLSGLVTESELTYTLDISGLTGDYYVVIWLYYPPVNVKIKKIWVE